MILIPECLGLSVQPPVRSWLATAVKQEREENEMVVDSHTALGAHRPSEPMRSEHFHDSSGSFSVAGKINSGLPSTTTLPKNPSILFISLLSFGQRSGLRPREPAGMNGGPVGVRSPHTNTSPFFSQIGCNLLTAGPPLPSQNIPLCYRGRFMPPSLKSAHIQQWGREKREGEIQHFPCHFYIMRRMAYFLNTFHLWWVTVSICLCALACVS